MKVCVHEYKSHGHKNPITITICLSITVLCLWQMNYTLLTVQLSFTVRMKDVQHEIRKWTTLIIDYLVFLTKVHAFLVFISCLVPVSNEQAFYQIQHLDTTRVHPYQAMLCINIIFFKVTFNCKAPWRSLLFHKSYLVRLHWKTKNKKLHICETLYLDSPNQWIVI